ncbi:hypothetical protein AZI86_07075 [Bdellovibrio bacteriovorus]|uniref:Uncharacterized protein n=1 Tax=Bdellovibrio bacteriovorus TaxID=959 RepID=A0A150WR41_BDEBC|nr:hypothetical protein [Bdellovibrio bacteriovorus]KYG66794.1 hypothetical protein AZI86_07075 [Bdellovibrio bacteriovorus]
MKLLKYSAASVCAVFLFVGGAVAAPLGTIPFIDTQFLRIILDLRSDLWRSPYSYKASPIRIINGEFRIPVAYGDSWNISANISNESLSLSNTEFHVADRDVFIGNNLQTQSIGLGINKTFSDSSVLMFMGAYATASDNPYAEPRDRWFEGNLVYRSKSLGSYKYILAVNQSANRGLANDRPFPYLGVIFQPNDNFEVHVGFPFMRILWQKENDWRRIAHVTPFGAYFDIEKNLTDDFVYHGRAEYAIRSYLYKNRLEDETRLYFQEMSLEGGIRKELTVTTTVGLALGYAFDRRLYESRSVYEPREAKTALDSDLYGRLRLEFNL